MDNTKRLVELLIEKNRRISAAESCTGGLFAASIVGIPDASRVFDGSFVTYAEWVKTKLVGVPADVIEKYGVVSREVGGLMAQGAARETGSQVAVGITGIAGPAGGTEEDPVGTVCFGFYVDGTLITERVQFEAAGRNKVRTAAVDYATDRLISILENA